MNDLKNTIIGSLLQDNYVLGLHWIYDTDRIASLFDEDAKVFDVLPDSFHKTKIKGDFTHYGDQTMMLMQYLIDHDQPDIASFYESFLPWFETYQGYKDKAMKMVASNIKQGLYQGSDSSELGGLCKIAPLLYKYADRPNLAKLYAIAFTKATHDHPMVVMLASYFTDVIYAVADGMSISNALARYIETMPTEVADLYVEAKQSVDKDPVDSIKRFGQACPANMAFPSVIYLLLKYDTDIQAMQKANILAGGDSAARGMMLGMVLGAAGVICEQDIESINRKDEMMRLISSL